MSNLEEYIRENAAAFDTEALPEGAEERFLDRLEAEPAAGSPVLRRFLFAFAGAAAAALALVFSLGNREPDWFRGVENTPEAVYASYLDRVADAWTVAGPDEEASTQLSGLTEEAIPLADQLPDELSSEQKAAILKAYYGELLDGVGEILRTIK